MYVSSSLHVQLKFYDDMNCSHTSQRANKQQEEQ